MVQKTQRNPRRGVVVHLLMIRSGRLLAGDALQPLVCETRSVLSQLSINTAVRMDAPGRFLLQPISDQTPAAWVN
jgi:hypothetical protein